MEYGYFDSEVTGFDDATGLPIFDRAQDSDFMAAMFASIWGNGVYPNPSDNLQVMERDDSQFGVKVMPGKLWIQGRFGKEIEVSDFVFDAASSTAPRIDIIVAELNKPNREVTLKYIKGTPATTPTAPELVRTSDVYQICLAQCTIRRNATKVNQSDILDTRSNTVLCGYVSGVITQVDTQTLFNQYLAKMEELNSLMEELGKNPPEGVMYQHVYDPTKSGVVVDAEKLGGQPPEYYKNDYLVLHGQATSMQAGVDTSLAAATVDVNDSPFVWDSGTNALWGDNTVPYRYARVHIDLSISGGVKLGFVSVNVAGTMINPNKSGALSYSTYFSEATGKSMMIGGDFFVALKDSGSLQFTAQQNGSVAQTAGMRATVEFIK